MIIMNVRLPLNSLTISSLLLVPFMQVNLSLFHLHLFWSQNVQLM
uniref:Uncharacterized protein n=1 Tax=Arundo donax TaxID=35708 RepID=A0A0A9C7L1_ARUDO